MSIKMEAEDKEHGQSCQCPVCGGSANNSRLFHQLQLAGLQSFKIAGDGNCLFAAFAHQLRQVRRIPIQEVELRDKFVSIVSQDGIIDLLHESDRQCTLASLRAMGNANHWDDAWGDYCLGILAAYYNVRVRLFDPRQEVAQFQDSLNCPSNVQYLVQNRRQRDNLDFPNSEVINLVSRLDHYDSTLPAESYDALFPNAKYRTNHPKQFEQPLRMMEEELADDPALLEGVNSVLNAVKSVNQEKMVLLGKTAVGKSTLIDTQLYLWQQSPEEYRKVNSLIEAELKDERFTFGPREHGMIEDDTKLILEKMDETKDFEKLAKEDMESYQKELIRGNDLEQYVLPAGDDGKSVTAHLLQVRPNPLFQAYIRFRSLEELEFIAETAINILNDEDMPSFSVAQIHRERLTLLTGMGWEDCLEFYSSQDELPPFKAEFAKMAQMGSILHCGLGKDINLDRYYIKTVLRTLIHNDIMRVAVESVDVLVPCNIPTLIDNPGIADTDPLKVQLIEQTLADEDLAHVMIVTDDKMMRDDSLTSFFAKSKFTQRLFRDPEAVHLAVISIERKISAKSNDSKEKKIIEALESCLNTAMETYLHETKRRLKKGQVDEGDAKPLVRKECEAAIRKIISSTRCLSIAPVIFASMKEDEQKQIKELGSKEVFEEKLAATKGDVLMDYINTVRNQRVFQAVSDFVSPQESLDSRSPFSVDSILQNLNKEIEITSEHKETEVKFAGKVAKMARDKVSKNNRSRTTSMTSSGSDRFAYLQTYVFQLWSNGLRDHMKSLAQNLVRDDLKPVLKKIWSHHVHSITSAKKSKSKMRKDMYQRLAEAFAELDKSFVEQLGQALLEQTKLLQPSLRMAILDDLPGIPDCVLDRISLLFDNWWDVEFSKVKSKIDTYLRQDKGNAKSVKPQDLMNHLMKGRTVSNRLSLDKDLAEGSYQSLFKTLLDLFVDNLLARTHNLSSYIVDKRVSKKHTYPFGQYVFEKFHARLDRKYGSAFHHSSFDESIVTIKQKVQRIEECSEKIKRKLHQLSHGGMIRLPSESSSANQEKKADGEVRVKSEPVRAASSSSQVERNGSGVQAGNNVKSEGDGSGVKERSKRKPEDEHKGEPNKKPR